MREAGQSGTQRRHLADVGFDLDLRIAREVDLASALGLKVTRAGRRDALDLILGQLISVAWAGEERWTAISRDKTFYAGTPRYRHPALTYAHSMWALSALADADAVEGELSRPGSQSIFRSRYRLRPEWIDTLPINSVRELAFRPSELVKLKDKTKQLIDYQDTARTRAMRRELQAHNDAIGSVKIRVNATDWHIDTRGFLRNGTAVVNPRKLVLYRVFNGDWQHGGRLYGAFWQNLPSASRLQLRIDGEAVVEHDFTHLHPTLMASIAGVDFKAGDPYTIEGFDRRAVKRGFNILLNAQTLEAAWRALIAELPKDCPERPGERAKALIEAIQLRHPQFSRYWGTGLGLRLQRIDSDLCVRVLQRMRAQGVVALPVHDSFIAPEAAGGRLLEAMDAELSTTLRVIRNNPLKIL